MNAEKLPLPVNEIPLDTEGLPALRALCDASAQSQGSEHIDSFKSLFDVVLQSRESIDAINKELEKVVENNKDSRSIVGGKSHIIFRTKRHALTVIYRDALLHSGEMSNSLSPSTVSSLQASCLMGVQDGANDVNLEIYEFPTTTRLDLFDPEVKLVGPTRVAIRSGGNSVALCAPNIYIVTSDTPCTFLRFEETRCLPYSWTFDAANLQPKFISATLPSVSRLQVVLELIEIQHNNGVFAQTDMQALETLTGNPYHFIRWKAIQLLFAIDPDKGYEQLCRALTDPHPHVAQAAKSSLAKIQAELL